MLLRLFVIIGSVFLLHSCASISPPSGGAKDERPPKLLRSTPTSNQLNFQGKELRLFFNEYIVLNNLNEQLIINPPIQGTYEAVARKNRLTIVLQNELKPNTTYTFNFRQGVKDMTEGNIYSNLKLAFSTGGKLDTLKIKGNAKDLLTNANSENLLISLYKASDTSIITKNKPLYFTKTDKEGTYILENIKEDNYLVYAFKDNNSNLYYDLENELIDYDSVNLSRDTSINFKVSKHYNSPAKVLSTTNTSKLITITLSKGIVSGVVSILDKKDSLIYNIKGNQVKVYNTLSYTDSIPLYIQLKDSSNNLLKDTVKVIFTKEKDKEKKKEKEKEVKTSFTIAPVLVDRKVVSPVNSLFLSLSLPIKQINYNEITVKIDTNLIQKFDNQVIKYDLSENTINLNKKLSFKDSVIININKGALISIYGDSIPAQKVIFTPKQESDYAILAGKLITKRKGTLIQLLNDKYQVVNEAPTTGPFSFTYVSPGTYYVRVVVDSNKNGKWDPGNFKGKIQPEEIYYYKEKIELRANWEITDFTFAF
ncbi:MAG TPA: Ig-like domain-containing protein [Cytophagaceae bacterium]|jgi:hypothetical protein